MRTLLTGILLFALIALNAQNEYQFRGINRTGFYSAKNLLKSWPENGPEKILTIDSLGKGYSSVIYYNDLIYITGRKDTVDVLTALDIKGNIKWQTPFGKAWPNSFPDSRSTPTIDNDKIYLSSGVGELVCIDAKTGKIIWQVNADKKYKAQWHHWGVSESPLIWNDLVFTTPTGDSVAIVAFNKETGEEVWKSDTIPGIRSYASPTIYKYKKIEQIIGCTDIEIYGVNPKDGKIEWQFPYFVDLKKFENESAIITNVPTYYNDEIFVSAGYNYPAIKLRIDESGKKVERIEVDTILDNHHHGLILLDGYLYGSNWQNNKKGKWVCKNWDTGEIMYEEEWGSKGTIAYADGLLYLFNEKTNELGLVKPSPEKFELISSFKVTDGEGMNWAYPTIYNGKLFIRKGEALSVYDISQK